MLHENAKQRLWRVVPTEFEVDWLNPALNERVTKTVSLNPDTQIRWARQGSAIEYPCIYLNIDPQGTPRGNIGHVFKDGVYKEPVADPEIAYRKYTAAPQRATLEVTVAVKQDHDRLPKRVVADQLAIDTWHEFRFESDHLSEMGVDPSGEDLEYAWPMSIRETNSGMDDTSRTLDEEAIERRNFDFLLEYAYFTQEEVPVTDKVRWRVGIDRNHDGDADTWTEWQETPGYDDSDE